MRRVSSGRQFGRAAMVVTVAVVCGFPIVGPVASAVATGHRWSVVPSPNPGVSNTLSGVSCVDPSTCTAVGHSDSKTYEQTLVETWDGANWTVTPSADTGSDSGLVGVSCSSAIACTAVGNWYDGSHSHALVESWDGTSWSVVATPAIGVESTLAGVSCVSPIACTAVGSSRGSDGTSRTLAEEWDGTEWSIMTTRNNGTRDNVFTAVSCTSAIRCTAVGDWTATFGAPTHTLVERMTGSRWAVQASPDQGPDYNPLFGVACPGRARCVAVGATYDGSVLPLVETWDGASWSITPTPTVVSDYVYLQAVSCSSVHSCIAVGYFDDNKPTGSDYRTLVEKWDGTSWSITRSDNPPGAHNNVLAGVSCPAARECTAVGSANLAYPSQSLVLSGR